MITGNLTVPRKTFEEQTGWTLKPEGACKGEVCVPLGARDDAGTVDITSMAERLGMPVVHDPVAGLWALGPATLGGHALQTAQAADFELPDLQGNTVRLSSLRGQKVLLLAWAPYCGCALDLPVWQRLRTELHPKGLEIVTVGLDVAGPEGCRPYIEAAAPEHPSLIDEEHQLAALFGVVNIPNSVWIDEDGVIVRPAEPAYAPEAESFDALEEGLAGIEMPQRVQEMLGEATKIPQYREQYQAALRDWVEKGSESRFALSPDEVVAASGDRDIDVARAAAHFELAQHLWREGRKESSYPHFQEAHRLQPENIAYKRQAWSLVSWTGGPYDRFYQGPLEGHEDEWPFESDMLTLIREVGAENYYPAPRL